MVTKQKYSWAFAKKTQMNTQEGASVRVLFSCEEGKKSDEALLEHKSVICLPGNGVHSNDIDAMSRFCRKVQEGLEIGGISQQDMPSIYTLSYAPESSVIHRLSLLEEQGEVDFLNREDFLDDEGLPHNKEADNFHLFFDYYLAPLLKDENGVARSFDEALLNIQNITFISFCHGGVLAKDIEKRFYQLAKKLYPDRYQELINQIRMVHFASRVPLFHQQKGKHLHIISQNDKWFSDDVISDKSLHKYFHQNKMQDKSALIAINRQEEVILFKDLEPFYVDQHFLILSLLNYQKPTSFSQKRAFLFNKLYNFLSKICLDRMTHVDIKDKTQQELILLTQKTIAHFVMHPQDLRSMSEILKTLSQTQLVPLLEQKGKAYVGDLPEKLMQEKQINNYLSDLSQFYRIVVRNEAPKSLLHSTEKGLNLYKALLNNYQQNPFNHLYRENLIAFLNKAYLDLPAPVLIQSLNGVVKNKDWEMMRFYMDKLNSYYRFHQTQSAQKDSLKAKIPATILEDSIRVMNYKDLFHLIEPIKYLLFEPSYRAYSFMIYLVDEAKKTGRYSPLLNRVLTQACERAICSAIKKKSFVLATCYLKASPLKVRVDKIGFFSSSLVSDEGSYDNLAQKNHIYSQIPPKELPAFAPFLDKIDFGAQSKIYINALSETMEYVRANIDNQDKVALLKQWFSRQRVYE